MAEAVDSPIVFWSVIIAYLIFLAVAGIRAKGKTHTFEDYMIAGRKIGPVLLGISFGVTYFSAVMIVGGGEFSWLWGLSSIWIAVVDCLVGVFAAFLFLGRRTMTMSKVTGSLTVSEMLGKRYQSEPLRKFTALVTLIFETVYLVSIYMGLSIMLQYAMPTVPIEISYTAAVIVCGVITIIYLNVGGAHGAITTDVAESLIMLSGVMAICITGIIKVGGIQGLIDGLNAIDPTGGLTRAPPGVASWGWVGYILVTSFGVWGMPQLISRYFTTQKRRSLRWGLVISVVWALIVSLFAWWNGAIGRVLSQSYPNMWIASENRAEVVPAMMNLLLGVFAPLFVAAVTAASLTTGEKVIMVASSSFSRDFYQTMTGADDKKTWRVTQITMH
ncbi:MAG: sodium:solute symporter family transporter [Promethearchaeota archaeon]